ncbi:hypothetical protein [Diplocloster modestus]|uniref:Uncharacterized protein n=1 Tax=Diplocloster modestus TaxID=2850322 RepID=A0ABS6K0P9_9FIRM|nr:hypothetical protein [Diplocloster modestus]MBU9724421.1 hypothetical protein [Diplocloster modestus]
MERSFDLQEIMTYNHTISIRAESDEKLDAIEGVIGYMIDEGDYESKDDLLEEIEHLGGSYEFIEDTCPDIMLE